MSTSMSRTKNLIRYVAPTILSSCCFFLFTIIDGIFVGHGVGTDALGAVNLVMPFVMVVNALLMMTTVGGVTVAAIRLGRNDSEGACDAFMHSALGTLAITVILSAAGTFLAGPLSRMLGAGDTFYAMVKDYIFWYSLFIIPSGFSTNLQGFCRNDGSPVLVSAAVIAGTAFNIFGDWLLVFPLGMGLKGAAIATGISQTLTLLIVLSHFIRKKGALRVKRFRPNGAMYRKIIVRGLPEAVAQFSTPVSTFCMNTILISQIGDIAVNAFSIIAYVASFSVAVFYGTAQGLQPLFGNCYGAKQEKDLKFYFRAGMLISLCGSVLITVLLYFVGGGICSLFGADEKTLQFTVAHMPQYAWGFIIMALNTIVSSYFYSTKRSRQAIVINVLRSFILNSLVIVLVPFLFGAQTVWYTFGIYESLVFLVGIILLKFSERHGAVYR